ncbi:MAG TPA: hypothetical protein DCX46_01840 [Bacteroidetes bacterium]|nr:hypothetical protein [Bacteroidota bacterium]
MRKIHVQPKTVDELVITNSHQPRKARIRRTRKYADDPEIADFKFGPKLLDNSDVFVRSGLKMKVKANGVDEERQRFLQ